MCYNKKNGGICYENKTNDEKVLEYTAFRFEGESTHSCIPDKQRNGIYAFIAATRQEELLMEDSL